MSGSAKTLFSSSSSLKRRSEMLNRPIFVFFLFLNILRIKLTAFLERRPQKFNFMHTKIHWGKSFNKIKQ